jgi:hypothetical protein
MLASVMKDTISSERRSSNYHTNLEILEVHSLQTQEESTLDTVLHGEPETQLPSFHTVTMMLQELIRIALTSITSSL